MMSCYLVKVVGRDSRSCRLTACLTEYKHTQFVSSIQVSGETLAQAEVMEGIPSALPHQFMCACEHIHTCIHHIPHTPESVCGQSLPSESWISTGWYRVCVGLHISSQLGLTTKDIFPASFDSHSTHPVCLVKATFISL